MENPDNNHEQLYFSVIESISWTPTRNQVHVPDPNNVIWDLPGISEKYKFTEFSPIEIEKKLCNVTPPNIFSDSSHEAFFYPTPQKVSSARKRLVFEFEPEKVYENQNAIPDTIHELEPMASLLRAVEIAFITEEKQKHFWKDFEKKLGVKHETPKLKRKKSKKRNKNKK